MHPFPKLFSCHRRRPNFLLPVLFAACGIARSQVITTIGGVDWLFPGDGRPAINAPLGASAGLDVTTDRNGNFYIADSDNQMVMRVGPDGIVNVIAGNGIPYQSGDGGLAINAGLFEPLSVALDAAGNVYIGEYAGTVRKITPDGIITRIAGNGNSEFSGDNGPATQAGIYSPYGLAVDAAGNIYIADSFNSRVRKITPDGIIRTVVGGGTGFSDGIPGTSFKLGLPQRICVDAAGNLYITNFANDYDISKNRILKLDSRGIITTLVGGGFSLEDGVLGTDLAILPGAIALDPAGNLYFTDGFTSKVRKLDTTGRVSSVAGSGESGFSGDNGPALKAPFSFGPYPSLAVESSGAILVADDQNGRIRRIDTAGRITTVAGNGLFHFSGDGGPATTAVLDFPTGVTGDAAGNLYVTEPFSSRIRKIASDGTISVYAGNSMHGFSGDGGPATAAQLGYPDYLAIAPDGSLAFSDSLNCQVRSIDTNGTISTLVGSPDRCDVLRKPRGIDFDSAGNLAIADSGHNRILAYVRTGSHPGTFLLGGTGTAGYSGDGGSAEDATFNSPAGLRIHGNSLYVADARNNVIRAIDLTSQKVTTVVGNGKGDFAGDGGPASKASLKNPQSINFDAEGNMYIADTGNSLIRKVDVNGIITTFAGTYKTPNIGDGQPPTAAFVGGPSDIYLRPNGDLVFTDIYFNRVREILNAPPSFTANPASLSFTAPAGSTPQDLGIDIAAAIPGLSFLVSTSSAIGAPSWLTTSVTSGRMPANLRVVVDPSKLAAGIYNATITITAPNAAPGTITIPVSLVVTAAGRPSLSVNPASLTFPFTAQAPPASRPISISNAGGGQISFTADVSTSSGGNWLKVSAPSGDLNAFGSSPLDVSADPTGLPPGTYSGVVTLASAALAQKVSVPVNMTITALTHTLLIPETGLSFFAVQNGGPPPPQNLDILNAGSGQMPWNVTTSTLTGGTWLSAFPGSGQTDASSPIVPQIRISVDPQRLTAGTYYGTVKVSSTGATNDPQFVSVIFTVLPPGSDLGPIVQPAGIIFTTSAGAERPGSQVITIQSTSATPISFTSGRVTANGGAWVQTLPESGTVTQSQPARMVLQPQTAGLGPGVYRGSLTLSFSDGNSRTVALLLVIPNGGTGTSNRTGSGITPRATGRCTPSTLAPVFTTIFNGFKAPAAYPAPTVVKVVDDCGTPMTTGGVTVTFNNGDPPLRLTSLKEGSWSGTWVPRAVSAEVLLTALAAIPEQNLKGQVQLKAGTIAGEPLPQIQQDGIVNGASFALLGPVAPGSLVTVFGSRLATGLAPATKLPLPLSLADASIIIGGQQVPLTFASDGQVNAVIPYGLAPNTTQQAIATRASTLSVPQPVIIAPAAPGVFTSQDGKQGMVVDIDSNGNQTLVDATHPARIGHALVIYCTGLGEVDPAVPTGSAAPSSPLSRAVNPVTVSIGGVNADVLFAGLTPAQVGLYQVNIVIPPGIPAGTSVPLVLSAAGQSSVPVTINVQ